MKGIIYILINGAMPDLIKIGKTTDLMKRIRELSNTSVPVPFECAFACEVEDYDDIERWLHDIFDDRRVRKNREFFEVNPERVVAALRKIPHRDVTPKQDVVQTEEEQRILNESREQGGNFNFAMVDIPVGAELVFTRNSNIRARVVDNQTIEINGHRTSLSRGAQQALGVSYQVRGPLFWKFEEETLKERRDRMEKE